MFVVSRFGSFSPFTSSYPENDVTMATSPRLALSAIDVTRDGSLVVPSTASVRCRPGRGHIDQPIDPLLAEVGHLRRRIERRAHDGDRMMQHLDPPIAGRGFARPRRVAVLPDVVRDVAIEPLVLPLHRGAREQELRGPELLHARPSVGQIDACA